MMEEENEQEWDEGLKRKERIFVLHYCTNDATFLNAAASYRAAYTKVNNETGDLIIPDQKTCESCGSRLLKRERVKDAARKLLKLAKTELDERTEYQIIHDLCTLSFYNPADILNEAGDLKTEKLEDLGEKAKCIAQITPTKYGIKYTLYDRNKAMHELLCYLNLIRPEAQIDVQLPVIEMVQKAISCDDWNASQGEE